MSKSKLFAIGLLLSFLILPNAQALCLNQNQIDMVETLSQSTNTSSVDMLVFFDSLCFNSSQYLTTEKWNNESNTIDNNFDYLINYTEINRYLISDNQNDINSFNETVKIIEILEEVASIINASTSIKDIELRVNNLLGDYIGNNSDNWNSIEDSIDTRFERVNERLDSLEINNRSFQPQNYQYQPPTDYSIIYLILIVAAIGGFIGWQKGYFKQQPAAPMRTRGITMTNPKVMQQPNSDEAIESQLRSDEELERIEAGQKALQEKLKHIKKRN